MRRTSRVLEQFLPPKIEHVVFLKPTDLQLELYRSFLGSSTVRSLLSGIGTALESIMHLKKLCNHPELLLSVEETEEGDHMDSQAFDFFPSGYLRGSFDVNISSKVAFLSSLLSKVKTTTSDKAVVISNYTKVSFRRFLQPLISITNRVAVK
jgi:DNA repair and recombination protein RAD54B